MRVSNTFLRTLASCRKSQKRAYKGILIPRFIYLRDHKNFHHDCIFTLLLVFIRSLYYLFIYAIYFQITVV